MTKVAIIGAGPCGLSMLRSFELAEKNGEKSLKLFVLKSKKIGVVYGIIVGEQDLINTGILYLTVCIDIFGQMDQKSV